MEELCQLASSATISAVVEKDLYKIKLGYRVLEWRGLPHERASWVFYCKIRPHRFGGEGVLIGGQSATLNAQ